MSGEDQCPRCQAYLTGEHKCPKCGWPEAQQRYEYTDKKGIKHVATVGGCAMRLVITVRDETAFVHDVTSPEEASRKYCELRDEHNCRADEISHGFVMLETTPQTTIALISYNGSIWENTHD